MIRYSNQESEKLRSLGYLRAFCAHKLNLKYIDYNYVAQGITKPESDKSTIFKHLVCNVENNLRGQTNMIREARENYEEIYEYVENNKSIVRDCTGWTDKTIDINLSFLKQAIKNNSECIIKDNEMIALYSIYKHQDMIYDTVEEYEVNTTTDENEEDIRESLGNIGVLEYVRKNFGNIKGFSDEYKINYSWIYTVDEHNSYSPKDIKIIKRILEIPPREIKSRRVSRKALEELKATQCTTPNRNSRDAYNKDFEKQVTNEISELRNQIEYLKDEISSIKHIKDTNTSTNENQAELVNEVIALRDKLWNSLMRF